MLCQQEMWIPELENKYSCDTEGNIYSYFTYTNGKLRKTKMKLSDCRQAGRTGTHYKVFNYSLSGVSKTMYVHRAVASTFVKNTLSLGQVNHKNGNKSDNRVENLEWVTPQENVQHAWDTGLLDRSLLSVSQSENVKRMENFCFINSKVDSTERVRLEKVGLKDFLESQGIPREIFNLPLKQSLGASEVWKNVVRIFSLIDDGNLPASEIAQVCGISENYVFQAKSGRRMAQQREIYDKYKGNPQFVSKIA